MKYVINNKTKEVFGFDESQDVLYEEYLEKKDAEYLDCRLPEAYEEWDSKAKKWIFNSEKANSFKIENLKSTLGSLISKYQVFTIPFQYSKLSKLEQEVLTTFLDECDNLLKSVTVDTIIPVIPDFLKEPEPLEHN